MAIFLVIIAVLGKVAGGYLISNSALLNRLTIGVGMVTRGAVDLVFVGIGAALDIILIP